MKAEDEMNPAKPMQDSVSELDLNKMADRLLKKNGVNFLGWKYIPHCSSELRRK